MTITGVFCVYHVFGNIRLSSTEYSAYFYHSNRPHADDALLLLCTLVKIVVNVSMVSCQMRQFTS